MTSITTREAAALPHTANTMSSGRSAVRAESQVAIALIGAALLLGLGLRVAAARGDLWLDELWSLDLVSHVTSPFQVFWRISHDNNHFLNSFWMALIGQNQSPLAYRLPSIAASSVAVLVAARIGWRVNPAAAVAAAAMASCSYAFVDYGSEARGYAGLILAVLVSIDLSQTISNDLCRNADGLFVTTRRSQWLLGLAIALGTCAHLTMVACAAILGVTTVLRLKASGRSIGSAIDLSVQVFRPSLILLVPVIACIAFGAWSQGGLTVGGSVPFTVEKFFLGYGGLLSTFLGTSALVPPGVAVLMAVALVAVALRRGWLDKRWFVLAIVALVLWPGLILAGHVKNTEYARYFLAAGLVLPVFLAEIAGRLWANRGLHRWGAAALVLVVCAGQIPDLRRLLVNHRGEPMAVVASMAAEGPALYRARNPMITTPVIDVYAERTGAHLTIADPADYCRHPAEWIVYDSDDWEEVPAASELGPVGCRARFAKVQAFPAALWSGRNWTLFRRVR